MRRFSYEGMAYISPEVNELMRRTRVRPGDVLLNLTGASIGRVACAPDDLSQANVNQHVAIVRPALGLDSRYLMYWLSQRRIQDHFNKTQKGATRQAITKSQIAYLQIPAPDLPIQRVLASRCDLLQRTMARLTALQNETERQLEATMPLVLNQAFKGRL